MMQALMARHMEEERDGDISGAPYQIQNMHMPWLELLVIWIWLFASQVGHWSLRRLAW